MLSRLYNRYVSKPLKLYWWSHEHPDKLNFGDEITTYVIEGIWGRKCVWAPPEDCELTGAGSIIEILQRRSKGNDICIWGSGFIQDGPMNNHNNLSFHAVRGKLSGLRTTGHPKLGDPGLLVPKATKGTNKRYHFGIMPHYMDKQDPVIDKLSYQLPKSIVIDVLAPAMEVAETISSCDYIISSSLHGLIVADAFGVPNIRLDISNRVTGEGYKFKDYASSMERQIPVMDKLALESASPPSVEQLSNAADASVVYRLQNDLIDSFPF